MFKNLEEEFERRKGRTKFFRVTFLELQNKQGLNMTKQHFFSKLNLVISNRS
jgi:hypothetical protein